MPKIAGRKITKSHTTCIDSAIPIVKAAEKIDLVSKISLGIINPCKGGTSAQKIKISIIDAGLFIKVRGSTSVQDIYIFTKEPKNVKKQLENFEK